MTAPDLLNRSPALSRGDCHSPCHDCREKQSPVAQASLSGHRLGALKPTRLEPCRFSKRRSHAVDALKQIEYLEVTRNDARTDRHVYFIDIYHHDTSSRIPVHGQFGRHSPSSEDGATKPSATIQVAYDDMLQLRYDTYELARASHLLDGCRFCHPLMFLNSSSDLKPRWNTHWFKSHDQVSAMLTTYLNEMLKLMERESPDSDDHCTGQACLPGLFRRFLRSHEEERSSV